LYYSPEIELELHPKGKVRNMLPQLKMFLDIVSTSDDVFGIPIKGMISKLYKMFFAAMIVSLVAGIGLGYLIFVVIL